MPYTKAFLYLLNDLLGPGEADDSFGVTDGAGFNFAQGGFEGQDDGREELVVVQVGAAGGEVLGKKDGHFLIEDAGGGVEAAQALPAFGAVAGFFFQLAAGAERGLFAGVQRAGRQLEQPPID